MTGKTKLSDIPFDELEGHFTYLDNLRDSGAINMWGAQPYLERARDLEPEEAATVFKAWRETFDHCPASDRVIAALQEKDG